MRRFATRRNRDHPSARRQQRRDGAQGGWQRTDDGIVVTPTAGPEKARACCRSMATACSASPSGPTAQLDCPASSLMVDRAARSRAASRSAKRRAGDADHRPRPRPMVDLATGNVSFRDAAGEAVLAESGAPVFAPASAEGQPFLAITPAVQPRHGRGLLRPRPAPEPADELQWRGRRARPAQHGHRASRSSSRPATTASCGTTIRSPASAIPKPYPFAGGEATG